MALTDIDFQEGEGQDFLLELALGALGTPADIVVESESDAYLLNEIPEVVGGGGGDNIFIIND